MHELAEQAMEQRDPEGYGLTLAAMCTALATCCNINTTCNLSIIFIYMLYVYNLIRVQGGRAARGQLGQRARCRPGLGGAHALRAGLRRRRRLHVGQVRGPHTWAHTHLITCCVGIVCKCSYKVLVAGGKPDGFGKHVGVQRCDVKASAGVAAAMGRCDVRAFSGVAATMGRLGLRRLTRQRARTRTRGACGRRWSAGSAPHQAPAPPRGRPGAPLTRRPPADRCNVAACNRLYTIN